MNHIYSLEKLNDEKEKINFEKVYTEMLTEQIKVIERFRNNMNKSSKLSLQPKQPNLSEQMNLNLP